MFILLLIRGAGVDEDPEERELEWLEEFEADDEDRLWNDSREAELLETDSLELFVVVTRENDEPVDCVDAVMTEVFEFDIGEREKPSLNRCGLGTDRDISDTCEDVEFHAR